MSKKTSRSARAPQPQRSATVASERKNAARPLINVENSRRAIDDLSPLESSPATFVSSDPENPVVKELEFKPTSRPVNGNGAVSLEKKSGVTLEKERSEGEQLGSRPVASARRPYNRRIAPNTTRQPTISREEEYAFIRSDLLAVTLLTILMFILLIALTFIIGR